VAGERLTYSPRFTIYQPWGIRVILHDVRLLWWLIKGSVYGIGLCLQGQIAVPVEGWQIIIGHRHRQKRLHQERRDKDQRLVTQQVRSLEAGVMAQIKATRPEPNLSLCDCRQSNVIELRSDSIAYPVRAYCLDCCRKVY